VSVPAYNTYMKDQRDYQRTRLYRSEWPHLENIETLALDDCWHFVTETVTSPYFVKHFPKTFRYLGADKWQTSGLTEPQRYAPNNRLKYLHYGDRRKGLKLRPGYRRRHAESACATITLPLWSRNKLTILHELAHICCWNDKENGDKLSAHGKEFAGIYLFLVYQTLSVTLGEQLHDSMQTHKVKVAPHRDTIGTP